MRTKPFECRSFKFTPEELVLGWPSDKWEDYKHTERPTQVTDGIVLPMSWLRQWLRGMRKDFPGSLIYGLAGVGKSAGMLLLGLEAGRNGCSVMFVTVEAILTEFDSVTKDFKKPNGKTKQEIRDIYHTPTVLLLDEWCARFYSDKERAFLLELIRDRQKEGRLTFGTTNLFLNLKTGDNSEQTFIDFFDGRALSTYKGWRIDASKWGPSLRGRDDTNTGA